MIASRKKAILQFLYVLALTSAAIFVYTKFIPFRLAWNITASIPVGLYIAEDISGSNVKRGAIGCFDYKPPAWAADRDYFPKDFTLCKYITGVPGDSVALADDLLTITPKDKTIAVTSVSYAKEDRAGRELIPAELPTGVLKSGDYLLIAPKYPNSFDSRYVGVITKSQFTQVIYPIPFLTWKD